MLNFFFITKVQRVFCVYCLRYMSLRTHEGRASSYRDDVESVGYLLIYFALGRLPWQGLPVASTDTKISMIRDRKNAITVPELCYNLPPQMADYIQAARSLQFNQFPNYNYFRSLLRGILRTFASENDRCLFDWQRPGVKLTVLPKVNHPTAASMKHDVFEQGVVDLRQPLREAPSVGRGFEFPRRTKKQTSGTTANAKGSLSYGSIPKPLNHAKINPT